MRWNVTCEDYGGCGAHDTKKGAICWASIGCRVHAHFSLAVVFSSSNILVSVELKALYNLVINLLLEYFELNE